MEKNTCLSRVRCVLERMNDEKINSYGVSTEIIFFKKVIDFSYKHHLIRSEEYINTCFFLFAIELLRLDNKRDKNLR